MDGKVIAITGGSSGIGKATARILASRGAKLSIADWNATSLAQLSAEFSSQYPDFLYTQLDVTQRAKVDDWIAQTVQHFGRLDGAANCAGVTGRTNDRMPLTEVDDEHWDVAIGVNLTGTMACLRAQLRAIVDGGSIVSIASVAGLEGIAGISPYCAAKHGIIGLTRSAAKEVAQRQIRVNAVAPGTINTPLYQDSMNDDPGYQMRRQAEQGDVDFITGDYLAEVSLAENAEAMRAGQHDGWFSTCWDGIEQSLDIVAEKNIKIIVNGGGLNPRGLAEKVQRLVGEKGYLINVAFVSGDDVLPEIKNQLQQTGELPPHLDSENTEVRLDERTLTFRDMNRKPLVAANAYLGARAILAALDVGADIIICGRVADASPVIAAAWWWHGWRATDYDQLAGALLAGHLIECSGYVTGGNFSGFDAFDLDLLVDIPFGIAEIAKDGSCVTTMHDTGKGVINVDVVRCQLLYELQGAIYLNSDVSADLTNVKLEQDGKNRVRVTGVRGSPPPATTKLGIFYRGGYQCQLLLNATGYNTALKWKLLEKQVKYVLKQKGKLEDFDVIDFQVVGTPQANPRTQLNSTTYCRIFAQASDEATVACLRAAWAEFVMQHFSGLHYALDFRSAAPMRYIAYYPALYPQNSLKEFAHILKPDGSIGQTLPAGHPPQYEAIEKRTNFDTEPTFVPSRTETKVVRLGDVALGRSGDKGANINFGIFPRASKIWPWFQGFMSRARLRELIGDDWRDRYFIERMEFPGIQSVHFVVYGILDRGSSSTVALDNLGKGFADFIRDKWVEVPVEILDQLSSS
ncbi:hypothetical protein AYO21_07940 [Fonsecaea monophora]|uniref:Uncharacterized protein n=1 Tax=Fonsecaea monophora TaxID=254056 RepID=A0A177F0J1_9EURO|nr:hypothetical protein AYO21_07940 [Fonsecaea monophora]OAG37834.1 hypothetical protein AYO21_07940 [Fonsecaea monophora]